MNRTISVYILNDPRIGKRKGYVGWAYTDNIQKRYKRHLGDKRNAYRWNWIKKLRRLGTAPVLRILGEYPKPMWSIMERFWIAWYRLMGYELTNIGDGGKGLVNPTPEIRAKISMANKGRKLTEQGRKNLDRTGIPSPKKGKKLSKEQLAKMSASMKLKWQDPEFRAKQNASSRKGKPSPLKGRTGFRSEESLAKQSASIRLRWSDPEYRRRMSVAHSKLTAKDVLSIRKEYAQGNITQKRLGAKYSITPTAVSRIVNRKNWRYI
ncbi:GIY-YIG nuclease family protein [bacterium]|nr:GIY-YIG nuclease family protein [bacterium]